MRIWLALVIGLIGCSAAAEDQDGQAWFDSITQIINQNSVQSVTDLLPKLPPDLLKRHVLVFDSHSRQQASYENPRVLLISPEAKFILTFNGDPSQRGYEYVETMRFTEKNGRPEFIFEEIDFPKDRVQREKFSVDSIERAERMTGQGPNAPLCLSCHRQNPRPNWAHYRFWPGMYGQIDDGTEVLTSQLEDPVTGELVTINNQDAARLLPAFIEAAPRHPRYRNLVGLDQHLSDAPQSRSRTNFLSELTENLGLLNFYRIKYAIDQSANPILERSRLLLITMDCNLSATGYPEDGFDLGRHALSSLTHDRFRYVFQKSAFAWADFFMDFTPGIGNTMTMPGRDASSLEDVLVKDDPDLRDDFNYYPAYPPYAPWAIPKPGIDVCRKIEARVQAGK